jgi:hypothetical protein
MIDTLPPGQLTGRSCSLRQDIAAPDTVVVVKRQFAKDNGYNLSHSVHIF